MIARIAPDRRRALGWDLFDPDEVNREYRRRYVLTPPLGAAAVDEPVDVHRAPYESAHPSGGRLNKGDAQLDGSPLGR
jgi:hypothetical protein